MSKVFHYDGRDQNGNFVSGNLDVDKIEEVLSYLEKSNIVPLNIKVAKKRIFNLSDFLVVLKFIGKKELELHDEMNFCRQLAALIGAGVPLIRAINQLAQSSSSVVLKNILLNVSSDISAGLSLGSALKRQQGAFLPIVVNTVEVGENTGHLNEVLLQISAYLGATIVNRRNLVNALRYPVLVLTAILAAVFIMGFFVIPKFMAMFSHFGTKLPLPTIIIMAVSNFLINHWGMLIIIFIGMILGIMKLLKIQKIHYFWDKAKLSLPVIGNIQRRIILSQFTWTFGLVLRSGLPIIKGLLLASESTGNLYFSKQFLIMTDAISNGEVFSRAATRSGLFTPMVIQMLEVGEESGKLDELILEVAKYYDAEVSYDMHQLTELIEPILLAIVGSIVLVLALGVFLPMWDLVKIIR